MALGFLVTAWTTCAVPSICPALPGIPSRALARHLGATQGCRGLAWGPA